MILNLAEILNNEGARIRINTCLNFESTEFSHQKYAFPTPVCVEGEAANIGMNILLSLKVRGEILTACAKCCGDAVYKFENEINEEFIPGGGEDEGESEKTVLGGDSIDLSELVLEDIFSNLPIRILCSESCRGLCPKCGKNLNEGDCGCTESGWDPRMEILKKLLREEEV